MSNEINIEELERLAKELIGSVPGTASYRDLSIVFTVTMSPDGVLSLIDRLKKAESELERERMRLAACGVVALADTPESAAQAREMRDEYRSASCDDVARRVDECMTLRAERDAMAARLAELEGQEPVAWVEVVSPHEGPYNFNGITLLGKGIHHLYARPVPAEPVNVDFGKRGENMFFKVGNQSFLLDYKPEEQDEFDFMKAMLLSAFSRITHGVKTESRPVNARLLDVATGKIQHRYLGLCPDSTNGSDLRDPGCPACQAITSAAAQQERLLQDMHDAGREIDRVMAVDAETVDRAWARFCGSFGDGPDAPYPGMIAAFETHYGQSFRDKEWRTEAACWAAAWSKATARADAKNDSYRLDALEAVAKASGTGVSFDWCRHVEDGMVVEHGYRMMWKHTIGPREKSIRHAIDAAMGVFKP